MAGLWRCSFLSFFFDRDDVEVNKNEQAWLIRMYYMAKRRPFTCGTNAGNPERVRWPHLACLGSQSKCRICLILPTRRFSHIIGTLIDLPRLLTFP